MNLSKGLLALALTSPVIAQTSSDELPQATPQLNQLITEWQESHGEAWQVMKSRETLRAELIYGGSAAPVVSPTFENQTDWFNLTRFWVEETATMHGASSGDMVDGYVRFLPLGQVNTTDKMTVRLHQRINGVPVENACINALYNIEGVLLSLHNTTSPFANGMSTSPSISPDAAVREATRQFRRQIGLNALEISEAELFIAQIDDGSMLMPRLAYKVSVHREIEGLTPLGFGYVIDAHTGAVIRRDEEVHFFDVEGTVQSLATPGTAADSASNPETPINMGYIRLTSSAGTVFADREGNFNFPGVNTPLDVTATYFGDFNRSINDNGANYSETFTVPANTPTTILMNPGAANQVTAQANAYNGIGLVRDFIVDTVPGDTTADFQAVSNVNLDDQCNAFFNGNSTNYFLPGGGCSNTAFSTVVYHEYGHWLNVLYGTGNGPDGMGEGNADVFALYVGGDNLVGEGFFTNGGSIRNGNNTRQFCGDDNGGCHPGVHANGEVWMGAAWKVRRNLRQTNGVGPGTLTANLLFMGWLNSFNQTQIRSIIETQWLMLDDDDGNILNGTPNFTPIDDGFLEQGFPGVELPFISFANVTQVAEQAAGAGPFAVSADIVAQFAPPVASPTLNYRLNDGSFISAAMSSVGGSTFSADIPSFGPNNGFVQYFVTAQDSNGETGSFGSADSPLEFTVGRQQIALFDFEATGDQGWTVGLPNTATTGIWERGNPNPSGTQPGNDNTPGFGNVNAWFTGQAGVGDGVGTNDVDGGTTSLVSPAFDLETIVNPGISYFRWYSNDQGGAPNADVLRIDLSNDNGATWVLAEEVGPTGEETNGGWIPSTLIVDQFVTPTSQVRLRVRASDLGDGSIVEAALDDVEVFGFGDTNACNPINSFCPATTNSTGQAAAILFSGSQDADDNNALLSVGNAPPGQFGLFFYGDAPNNLPIGNGVVCVGGNLFRLPTGTIDALGSFSQTLDIANPVTPAAQISNGQTWYFSFWFRDNVGAGFNFSDGISVEFCDL